LLADAIAGVQAQQYPGPLAIAVIYDGVPVDAAITRPGELPVRAIANFRTPGLSGARNSGIVTSSADVVAFCDDDDQWLAGKLIRQMERRRDDPDARFVTTAIRVDFAGRHSLRLAGMSTVPHERLLESRMAMLHSSTFAIDRNYLLDRIGLVDETAPGGQNEDWELLLRASRDRPIAHVDEPLVAVRWGSASAFARQWESKIEAARWIIGRYPEIRESRVGYARILGQIAFAHAALGHRRQAFQWALRAERVRASEPRGYLASAVAAGLPATVPLALLHRRGHGV
jgi:glycosyltransferase involved in cell wall biosynthesis